MTNSNFIICKVSKTDIDIIIDGVNRRLARNHADASQVLSLASSYNTTSLPEARETIKQELIELLNPAKRISLASDGRFEYDGEKNMYLVGTSEPIPNILTKKLLDFISNNIPVEGLVNFWKQLLLNPDKHVREQCYRFIEHRDIAITDYGYLVCYKAVDVKRKYNTETGEEIVNIKYDEETGERVKEEYTQDLVFKPFHSGNHGMVIKIGQPITMPREECDNDPNRTCSAGLHVGAIEYVKDFGNSDRVILECLVSPRNIVSIPADYNDTKMRCCEYYPISITNGVNDRLYLESDYRNFDLKALDEELIKYEASKIQEIAKIEESYNEYKRIADSLKK